MDRRLFIQQGSVLTALFGAGGAVFAQGKPVEGQHYRKLRTAQPTSNPGGELLEFFSFTCPACYAFDPTLQAWLQRKPAQLSFKRVPLPINAIARQTQRVYYTLETMGVLDKLHSQVFAAVQADLTQFQDLGRVKIQMSKLGVDAERFASIYESFGVQTRCQQAEKLATQCDVNGVPELIVNGRYATSPKMAGGAGQAMAVVEHLLHLPA